MESLSLIACLLVSSQTQIRHVPYRSNTLIYQRLQITGISVGVNKLETPTSGRQTGLEDHSLRKVNSQSYPIPL